MTAIELMRNGRESIDGLTNMIAGARSNVTGELFRFSSSPVIDALDDAARLRGVDVQLHHGARASDEAIARPRLGPAGVEFRPYFEGPSFIHAKAFSADGERLWIGSAALTTTTPIRNDISLMMGRGPATAFERLAAASARGDVPQARSAAAAARDEGVVVNDPQAGVAHLTEAIDGLIANEPDRLLVLSKSLRDPRTAALLARRGRDGLPVQVVARDLDPALEAEMRDAGVTVSRVFDPAHKFHTNVVVGSSGAYVGSAHLTPRALSRGGTDEVSLEMGAYLTDPAAVAQVRDAATRVQRSGRVLGALGKAHARVEYFVRDKLLGRGFT